MSIYDNLGCSVVNTCDHRHMYISHGQACNIENIFDHKHIGICLSQAGNIVGNAWH